MWGFYFHPADFQCKATGGEGVVLHYVIFSPPEKISDHITKKY